MKKSKGLLKSSLANKSVVERVVDQITGAIINGELKPGDKLPTELELSESFEVGRNSVREAVKVLTSFGVLRVRRAEGTFVCEGFSRRMLDPMLYGLILQKDSAQEITELRQVFDTGILQVALEKADEADFKRMHRALAVLEKEILRENASPEQVLDADIAFHSAILEATDNALISSTAEYIDRITVPSRVRTTRWIIENGLQTYYIDLHARIVSVVEERRADLIAETIREHYQFWKKQAGSEEQTE